MIIPPKMTLQDKLPQTPIPLTLDYKAHPEELVEHLCWSSDPSFLKVLEKGESREQEQQGWATGSHEGERGSGEQRHCRVSVCKERCSLAGGDLQCILQNLWICSFLNVQTKSTALRMLSHCLHVKQNNQTFPSPFSLPPHLHVLQQINGHELGWQLLRRSGQVLVFGMLYHKQNLLFHCKRKFLKFNFLIKFIFNDQTLPNIMYTCTQQEFLLEKNPPPLKRIMTKITKTAAWIFIFLPKALLKHEKHSSF